MTEIKRLFDIPKFQLNKYNLPVAFVTKTNGKWQPISSKEYVSKSNNLSKALLKFGVKPNDKIAIITNRTRTEWHIADIAIMQIGAQSVPIYDSTSIAEMEYIFNHAEIKFCFVASKELFKKTETLKSKTLLKKIISFDKIIQENSIYDLINIGESLSNLQEVERIKNNGSTTNLVGKDLSHHEKRVLHF